VVHDQTATIAADVVNADVRRRLDVGQFECAPETRKPFHYGAPCGNIGQPPRSCSLPQITSTSMGLTVAQIVAQERAFGSRGIQLCGPDLRENSQAPNCNCYGCF
jgi:hypothetical protein